MNGKDNNKQRPDDIIIKGAKVLAVTIQTDNNGNMTRKLSIKTNATFPTIDLKTGAEQETDTFGKAITAAVKACELSTPELQMASTLALGRTLNPQIVALCLTNGTINITRHYNFAGESRQKEGETYTSDCWTTEITGFVPNINPLFLQQIAKLIDKALVMEEAKPTAVGMAAVLGL